MSDEDVYVNIIAAFVVYNFHRMTHMINNWVLVNGNKNFNKEL